MTRFDDVGDERAALIACGTGRFHRDRLTSLSRDRM